ncbi:MAG: hypothetical protein DMG13_06090 [Acidobacteria bacterium]|nr:MAG: hypothetical protein DMG13_06090 [Acidobacteriota bacterium]
MLIHAKSRLSGVIRRARSTRLACLSRSMADFLLMEELYRFGLASGTLIASGVAWYFSGKFFGCE